MIYSHILFDLDGTLTDPAEGIINSVIYSLNSYGIEADDREDLKKFIGPPLHESFVRFHGFSEKQAFEAVDRFREYFADQGIFENKIFQGITELLERLIAENKILILATSKPHFFAEKILKHFNLYHYFSDIVGANMDGSMTDKTEIIAKVLSLFPDIDTSNFLMIGDREHDIIGANNNGVDSVWVGYGYGVEEVVLEHSPKFTAGSVSELSLVLH